MTWNYPNCIGYPNFRWEHKDKGLTAFGEEVVAEMNRLGMIIDVSHLSDQGFYDVAELSGKPFIASHSNARAVTNHWRNLTDDMLRKLAEKGGVAGLNLEPEFLGEVGSVEAMTRHVIHMINAAGIEAVAIGTDFDGCSLLTAIKDAGDMHKLWDELSKAGLSGRDMDKIMHKNVERVIRDVMG